MLRAAALASAAFAVFFGVMYLRFSGDSVPAPAPTPSPAAVRISIGERCESYVRIPKPPQCEPPLGPVWWAMPTVPPTPVAKPDFLHDLEVLPLEVGSAIELPPSIALIVETGCWQCDGPTAGLTRVYRDSAGVVRIHSLLDPANLGLGERHLTTSKGVEVREPYITGFAVASDASDIFVSICVRETCGSGGLDSWSPGSETVILRSLDGGITWHQLGRLNVGGFVLSLAGDGQAIVGKWDADGQPASFAYFPSLEPVHAPLEGSWPVGFLDGQVLWRTPSGGGLMLDDQHLIDFGGNAGIASIAVAPPQSEPRLAVSWNLPRSTQKQAYFLTLIDSRGRSFDTYGFGAFAVVGVNLITELLGNAESLEHTQAPATAGAYPLGYLPATIDLATRTIHPILQPFTGTDFPRGRNQIVAIQRGPFARIVKTDDTCLNIRSAPNTGAEIPSCAAEDVLLRTDGSTGGDGTNVFLHVFTPSGVEGWASTAYLEY